MFGFGLRLGNLKRSSNVAGFTGVLDGYSSGLAGAWSVSRRLLSSYSGPLIRVRESTGNTELDIGSNSNGELDTSTLLSFCGSGDGCVVRVYGQSDAINMQQSTASAQPKIVSSGSLNTYEGKPAMLFATASNQFLQASSSFTGATWIVAAKLLTSYIYPGLVTSTASSIILIGSSNPVSAFASSLSGYKYYANTFDKTATMAPFCYPNTKVLSLTTTSAINQIYLWGSERNLPTRYWNGYSNELLVYSNIPSSRSNIETILMNNLGLS